MLEIWRNPPPEAFYLAKYLMGPPGAVLFLAAVPLLWLASRRLFRPALLTASLLVLVVSWGPTFAVLLVLPLIAVYPLVALRRRPPILASFLILEIGYVALFHLPLAELPVYTLAPLRQIYPGLLTDRELVFYLGLAFTNLRLLHLLLRRREGDGSRMSLPRYLLYLLYAPTYRLGPYVSYDDFDRRVDERGVRVSGEEVLRGLAEVALGAVLFEAVVKGIDAPFFKLFSPDDGSYWYLGFFDRPPSSRLASALGIYLISLRYYLFIKAYSHVARGMSRMIGIRLPKNMNWPLTSVNLVSFWRRYHVTLSEFAQAHVLRPLAKKTRGAALPVLGTFVFMGLWHRPALHTLCFGILQVAGIAIWSGWRILRFRWTPLRTLHNAIPREARQVIGILVTLNFVVWTVPVLLDIHHGGARLIGHVWTGR